VDKPRASTVTEAEAIAYAESLVADGRPLAEIQKTLKSLAVMTEAIGDRSVGKLLHVLAQKAGKSQALRQPDSGQFRHTHDLWMCVCGHPLAMHTGDKTKHEGTIYQPCIVGDFTACTCDCEKFQKTRPATKASPEILEGVRQRKYVNSCPDFMAPDARLAAVVHTLGRVLARR
jgi:hypothetical protein